MFDDPFFWMMVISAACNWVAAFILLLVLIRLWKGV